MIWIFLVAALAIVFLVRAFRVVRRVRRSGAG
jgi:hypothetical protein